MPNSMQAIGFDLFNTLITVEPHALDLALSRLVLSLEKDGIRIEQKEFGRVHRQEALQHIADTKLDGKETHNRFWISSALNRMGHSVFPEDPRIARAVEAYFTSFFDLAHLIPETLDMLTGLEGKYRLGLLSNFTHAPAARGIIEQLKLAPFFETVVISGELGYRKPHPATFEKLTRDLDLPKETIFYVGDDPECDVAGARNAGLKPIWSTYVRDRHIPFAPGVTVDPGDYVDDGVPRISDWGDLLELVDH